MIRVDVLKRWTWRMDMAKWLLYGFFLISDHAYIYQKLNMQNFVVAIDFGVPK